MQANKSPKQTNNLIKGSCTSFSLINRSNSTVFCHKTARRVKPVDAKPYYHRVVPWYSATAELLQFTKDTFIYAPFNASFQLGS